NYVIRWQPSGMLSYPQCNTSDDLSFSLSGILITGDMTQLDLKYRLMGVTLLRFLSMPNQQGRASRTTPVHR
ncbi:hypothetical protein, partial [Yersinia enterocolitica]|uniref:hypothetical protein n=1 Tax=Yersinia enterocolitica TaxID=630 RepID=UPI001C93200E